MSSREHVTEAYKQRYMDPGPLQSVYTRVNGITMHACVSSSQPGASGVPPIVLVHGSGLSGRYMIPTAAELASSLRVYLPDMPGFGRSDKPREIYGVPELADWLVAWMEAVNLERASFLGNSFGCQVIADLAARHPEHVDRVLLQGPTTPPDERSIRWQFVRWRQNQRFNPAWLGDVTNEAYRQTGWRRMYRYFFIQIRDPMEDKMPHVAAPVLIIRGEHDPIANQTWCEQLAALAPHGRLAILPDVAHTLCFTAPGPLARVAREFVLGEHLATR